MVWLFIWLNVSISGCGMNFHKRCVVKAPNNCSLGIGHRRRSSTFLNILRSPSQGSTSSLISGSDENHSATVTPNSSQNNSTLVCTLFITLWIIFKNIHEHNFIYIYFQRVMIKYSKIKATINVSCVVPNNFTVNKDYIRINAKMLKLTK